MEFHDGRVLVTVLTAPEKTDVVDRLKGAGMVVESVSPRSVLS